MSLEIARKQAEALNNIRTMTRGIVEKDEDNNDDQPKTPEEVVAESRQPRKPISTGFRTLMGGGHVWERRDSDGVAGR